MFIVQCNKNVLEIGSIILRFRQQLKIISCKYNWILQFRNFKVRFFRTAFRSVANMYVKQLGIPSVILFLFLSGHHYVPLNIQNAMSNFLKAY